MAHAVARRGYQATSVAEVIRLAGVSRATFYEHFSNKQDCLLSACSMMAYRMMKNIDDAYQSSDDWERALRAAFRAMAHEVIGDPCAARIVILGVAGAGPEPVHLARRARALCERRLRQSLARSPRGSDVSAILIRGIVGAIRSVVGRRLLEGRTNELPGICDELFQWTLCYHVSAAEPTARDTRASGVRDRANERANDCAWTAIAQSDPSAGRMVANAARSHVDAANESGTRHHHDSRGRAFHAHFQATTGTCLTTPNWPSEVHESLGALIKFVAAHPNLGRLGFTELASVENLSTARVRELLSDFVALVSRGYELTERPPPKIASEAIAGAIWENVQHETLAGRIQLPGGLCEELCDLALTPFIGPLDTTGLCDSSRASRPDAQSVPC